MAGGDETEPRPPADPTSARWVRRAVAASASDPEWQALFDRYRVALTMYAARQLGPRLARQHTPEDLVQAAWADVYARIGSFEYRGRGSLRAWLRIKIRREAQNLARKESLEVAELSSPLDEHVGCEDVDREVDARELRDRLAGALDTLPETYRRVVEARFIEGRRVKTIARAYGLKPDTVSQQLRRGLTLWRQALGGDPTQLLGEVD